jgi:hemolysin activation/secretion protein
MAFQPFFPYFFPSSRRTSSDRDRRYFFLFAGACIFAGLPMAAVAQVPSQLPSQFSGGAPSTLPIPSSTPLDGIERRSLPVNVPAPELLPTTTESSNLEKLPPPTGLDDTTGNVADQDLKIKVKQFDVVGSTIFKPEDFAAVTAAYVGRELSFTDILQVRSAITKLYTEKGYVTTGALVVPQTLNDGTLKIQVVEGEVETISVKGHSRLREQFIRDRIQLGTSKPLNVTELLSNLQSLRLDPRIKNLSADLQSGIRPGSNRLQVEIEEADTFGITTSFDNGRSPSVGSFRRKVELREANLFGFGDTFNFGYSNTRGSNGIDVGYALPINAKNGTLSFNYSGSRNKVIEDPFSALDIVSKSRYYEVGFRQPLVQKPTQELAIGFNFARQESQTELGIDNIGPFPLSPGADSQGRTNVSALRFFQEFTERSNNHVFALRSQFSVGLNWLGATTNETGPDSRFLSWRGQGQWVQQLAPETLFLIKGDLQFASKSLLPLEQFGLGGVSTVRGYRQDAILSDSGLLMSAEVRLPIVKSRKLGGVLQIAPFFDFGAAWNVSGNQPTSRTLFGTGLGLIWKQGDRFSARLDWGIPLSKVESEQRRSAQENGLYFSVNYTAF